MYSFICFQRARVGDAVAASVPGALAHSAADSGDNRAPDHPRADRATPTAADCDADSDSDPEGDKGAANRAATTTNRAAANS